ncbi:MAG: hypothetical protein AABZ39_19430 [Spirochaetota bacterium]
MKYILMLAVVCSLYAANEMRMFDSAGISFSYPARFTVRGDAIDAERSGTHTITLRSQADETIVIAVWDSRKKTALIDLARARSTWRNTRQTERIAGVQISEMVIREERTNAVEGHGRWYRGVAQSYDVITTRSVSLPYRAQFIDASTPSRTIFIFVESPATITDRAYQTLWTVAGSMTVK